MKIGLFHKIMRLLGCALVLFPHYALAGQVNIPGFYGTIAGPSRTMLPQAKPQGVLQGATIDASNASSQNQLVINQNQQNAVIDWSSFNIGADAGVHFNQQGNASWSALNRIWDANPSLIFGKLTADGKIYLINQNGILFGPGSIVNVNSLVASALNVTNNDFLNNVLHFRLDNYQALSNPDPLAIVANHGTIQSNALSGGYVFLMAPRAENYGTINVPAGQIGLVAGTDIQLNAPDDNNPARSYSIYINNDFVNSPASSDADFGRVVNGESGRMYADGGVAGMYGNNIDQWGVIRSITAYRNNKGQVELMAANKITTGANSVIALSVDDTLDPATGLPPTISDTFDIQPVVTITNLNGATASKIDLGGSIIAPAGKVTLNAADHVVMQSTSSIDVSGAVMDLPVALVADTKLTSVELRDNYDQKGGVLQGEKITTPVSSGSSIGDISQTILSRDKTAWERLAGGAIRKHLWHDPTNLLPDHWVYETQTGTIKINSVNGDINISQGASLNFSGGRINYQSGLVNTTKLLSGTQIYDIANAPVNVHYNGVLGNYEKTYDRFGIRESYSGIYYGGASSLKTYVQGYSVGGDAGSLSLNAPKIILDGQLNGGVTRGEYQNAVTASSNNGQQSTGDYYEALMLSKALGRETPQAGTLTLAASSISVVSETGRPTGTAQETTQLSARTLNNANLGTVNLTADLTITTAADTALTLQPGGNFIAQARLIDHEGSITVPGGTIGLFAVQNSTGRQDAAGTLNPNPVLLPNNLTERIILGKNSVLDASGERIDNSRAGTAGATLAASGRTTGGSINLKDNTDQGAGVFVQAGAVVDVSGGYTIDQKGKITGGSAGTVGIQGANIQLDGDLRGYALADPNGKLTGGAITLSSLNSTVAPAAWIQQAGYTWSSFDPYDPASSISSNMKGKFSLADNRFDDTGFTQITVNSKNDLTIQANTAITPSLVRLNNPVVVQEGSNSLTGAHAIAGKPDLVRLDPSMDYMAGPSKFAANAGIPFPGSSGSFQDNLSLNNDPSHVPLLLITDGAMIRTTPGGSISLSGPAVTVNGKLDSRSGTIAVKATGGNLLIGDNAGILAVGYNRPDPSSTPGGYSVNSQPMNGGSVSLTASAILNQADTGNLTIAKATIDVSGSDAVSNTILSGGKITTYQTAGNPGSLSLNYGGTLAFEGAVIRANDAKLNGLSGISGGTIAMAYTYPDTANLSKADKMYISDYIRYFLSTGFDDLTFRSNYALNFDAAKTVDYSIGRKLTLDAPEIAGNGATVNLSAPWLVLTNTSKLSSPSLANAAPAAGTLTLSGVSTDASGGKHGGFIDVIGDIQLDGFQDVTLQTGGDIRLSQVLYDDNYNKGQDANHQGTVKPGMLRTTGDLILDAARIYPGNYYEYDSKASAMYGNMYSDYTLHADGKAIVQHTVGDAGIALDSPIYSAGGTLTIEGLGGVEVKKDATIAAPLGAINLTTGASPASGSRIYLENGSTLTTAGNADVLYGGINSNNLWVVQDKANPSAGLGTWLFTADMLPQKGVNLAADEVIIRQGAVTDVSGGGSVFAYKFQPGVEGSTDPLAKPGRYVVFAADSMPMPGAAVYLQGGGGLSAGMYTLLDLKNPQNARYAFMPGAHIIEAQAGAAVPGQGALSKDGYPLLVGYSAVADTSILGTKPQVYTVRTASEVLATEGSYVRPTSFVSGDAGDVTIKANSMVLQGTFNAAALTGYHGSKISLAATDITVQASSASLLPLNFSVGTPLDAALTGKLYMSGDTVQGFREVDLGDVDATLAGVTNSITIKAGAQLNADVISLSARKTSNSSITLENGANLTATTGDGGINLTTGTLDIESNAIVHAAHAVTVDANDVKDMKGSLESDGGSLTLKSSAIYIDNNTTSGTGLHLAQAQDGNTIAGVTGFQDITLISNSSNNAGILFYEDFKLSAGNSLTMDANRIANMSQNAVTVNLEAPTINFKNSGVASTLSANDNAAAGDFTATAVNPGGIGTITVGAGDVPFANFSRINLNSQNDLAFAGKGSLSTGNAELSISAARVATSSISRTNTYTNVPNTTSITPTEFTVDAGTGNISVIGNGNANGQSSAIGGTLEFRGASIDQGGVIQANGGSIKLSAMGPGSTDSVTLRSGSQILARGTTDAPGGQVALKSANGGIVTESLSLIDVSAGSQGDAGLISLQASNGGVLINGGLMATAQGGVGGSLVVDTYQTSNANTTMPNTDMTQLIGTINTGGFTESIDLRAKTGNINIAPAQTLQAHHVKITADDTTVGQGQITVSGTGAISASRGGSVELYAMNDLTIQSGGSVNAANSTAGSSGGSVLLSSEQGWVYANGTIDVSGGTGGTGGTIYLRAQRDVNDVKINLGGPPQGAAAIYVEPVKTYQYIQTSLSTGSQFNTWLSEAASFIAANTALGRLQTQAPTVASSIHLLPGIEVVNTGGDITIDAPMDMSLLGNDTNPGVMTIRAAGNLNINSNLTDYPEYHASMNAGSGNPITSLSKPGRNSWGFNLVAGANPSSADYMAVNTNARGDLRIADSVTVYTESAPIRFASGGDTMIGVANQYPGYMISPIMNYNLASFSGSIRGNVGRDLMVAGAIQTATGDIDISVGRDLELSVESVQAQNPGAGAIRTTGRLSGDAASAPMGQYSLDPKPIDPRTGKPFETNTLTQTDQDDLVPYQWRYAEGGNITLDVGGRVGKLDNSGKWITADSGAWDYFSPIAVNGAVYGLFSANYWYGTAGLATMGGGNLSARTGGDFFAQAGTFGSGNLTIYSGGDIRGRFINTKGQGNPGQEAPGIGQLHATGNIGAFDSSSFTNDRVQIELMNSTMNVTAQGEIQIGAILNPALASDQISAYRAKDFVYCSYTPETSIGMKAGTDLTIAGRSPYYTAQPAQDMVYEKILPATVDAVAGGNVYLLNDITLASSPKGDLNLRAGGDVAGQVVGNGNRPAQILVSDMAPANWYGLFSVAGTSETNNGWIGIRTISNRHGLYNPIDKSMSTPDSGPLHTADPTGAIEIHADRDVKNLKLLFPKKAEVTAGRDISDITYDGQNISPDDISMIRSGGDISMKYGVASSTSSIDGLTQGGPGVFLVQAGGSIDLGSSLPAGIQEISNGNNPALGTDKSRLIILSGYTFGEAASDLKTADDVNNFFSAISSAGDKYAKLMADGKLDDAAQLLQQTRDNNIAPLLNSASGSGNINMTSSQISTSNAASDVFIIANGSLNLGKTALPSATVVNTTSGITTANGGSVNIFAVNDINVQESRVMTFFSRQDMVDPAISYGDITVWSDNGNINAGRGSRTAVSASPPKLMPVPGQVGVYRMVFTPPAVGSGIRAVTYGENPPPAGNVHLFAPTGVIDAGEAGIAGSSVTLAALKITNASNISFSAGSIGVPQQSASTAGLGTLAGSGITQNTQMNTDSSGIAVSRAQASQMVEDIIAKWLDVKVVDFVEDENKEE